MTPLKAIIIEDEKLAADLLSNQISERADISLLGVYENGFSGLKAIHELKPDLVFLDIELPKLTGLELLELLEEPPMVIFTTAYNQYAIDAFEKNAVDYLLKPFSKNRLFESIEKAKNKISQNQIHHYKNVMDDIQQQSQHFLDRIAVKNKNNIHLIATPDIYFLEAQDDYVAIHTANKMYLKNARLKFYEKTLDPKKFIRVHRSYIVNTSVIQKLENYNKDSYLLILNNQKKINISRSGLQLLRQILYL